MKKLLAQVNIAKMKEPLEHDVMKEFRDFLDPINQLAEDSPGFVWRLKDDDGQSFAHVTSPFEDDLIIINMSVWDSVDDLKNYVYDTAHSYFVRSKKKWFNKLERPHMALWWVAENEMPTVEEAARKLKLLEEQGPSQESFNFKQIYDHKDS